MLLVKACLNDFRYKIQAAQGHSAADESLGGWHPRKKHAKELAEVKGESHPEINHLF